MVFDAAFENLQINDPVCSLVFSVLTISFVHEFSSSASVVTSATCLHRRRSSTYLSIVQIQKLETTLQVYWKELWSHKNIISSPSALKTLSPSSLQFFEPLWGFQDE